MRGEPFGVGKLTLGSGGGDFRLNLPRAKVAAGAAADAVADLARRLADKAGVKGETASLENTEMSLVERSGRIFYPVFEKRERPILREFINVPKQVTVHFLFVGDGPLDLTLFTPAPRSGSIVPIRDPVAHARLLKSGGPITPRRPMPRSTPSDFPPLVEEYLVDTLSRRLRLPLANRPPNSGTEHV